MEFQDFGSAPANGISGFRVSACEWNLGITGQRPRMEMWDSGSAPANGISRFRVSACESQLAMALAIASLGLHEIANCKTGGLFYYMNMRHSLFIKNNMTLNYICLSETSRNRFLHKL